MSRTLQQKPITFYPDPPSSDTTRVRDAIDRIQLELNARDRTETLRRIIIMVDDEIKDKKKRESVFRTTR